MSLDEEHEDADEYSREFWQDGARDLLAAAIDTVVVKRGLKQTHGVAGIRFDPARTNYASAMDCFDEVVRSAVDNGAGSDLTSKLLLDHAKVITRTSWSRESDLEVVGLKYATDQVDGLVAFPAIERIVELAREALERVPAADDAAALKP